MTARNRKIVSLSAILLLLLLFVAGSLWRLTHLRAEPNIPKINGFIINEPKPLASFQLSDHQNNSFTQQQLKGHWHIITYGYTHCPDVCPTMLMTMVGLEKLLNSVQMSDQFNILFYSVDPTRDSAKVLTQYVRYFSPNFTAIYATKVKHKNQFERILGIKSEVTPPSKPGKSYLVSHSTSILIINPAGQLQAVLLPTLTELGVNELSAEQVFEDLTKISQYVSSRSIEM